MTEIESLKIKKFDISNIRQINGIIIGRRNVGKTTLITDILRNQNILDKDKTIFAKLENEIKLYSDMFPDATVCDYDPCDNEPNILEEAINRHYKETKRMNQMDKPEAIVVLDNCLYDASWCKDKNIKKLFLNGKVFKHSILISMSYPLGIPPVLREQIDYVFVFGDPYLPNRRLIWEKYLSSFSLSFEMFNTMMVNLLQYECYVFHFSSRSSNSQDEIFSYTSSQL